MSWGKRYPEEQQAAQHALLAATQAISSELSSFSGWLMAGCGAGFALLLANFETIAVHVDQRAFKWSLAWFSFSLLIGLFCRWLAAAIAGVVAALGAISARADRIGPTIGFSTLAFTKFIADASLPIYRCNAWRGYRRARSGDFISGIRSLVRKSQWQSILTLAQVILTFVSIAVLAYGVKA